MLHTVTYADNVKSAEQTALTAYRIITRQPYGLTDYQVMMAWSEDAGQMVNQLERTLQLYGDMYTARSTRVDGQLVVECICCDHWSVNDSHVIATCWLDDDGNFYYES